MSENRVYPIFDQSMFFLFSEANQVSKVAFASEKGSYPQSLANHGNK